MGLENFLIRWKAFSSTNEVCPRVVGLQGMRECWEQNCPVPWGEVCREPTLKDSKKDTLQWTEVSSWVEINFGNQSAIGHRSLAGENFNSKLLCLHVTKPTIFQVLVKYHISFLRLPFDLACGRKNEGIFYIPKFEALFVGVDHKLWNDSHVNQRSN